MSDSTLPAEKTALPKAGVRELLRQIDSRDEFGNPPPARTGAIVVENGNKTGRIYLKNGRLYAVHYTGFTPPIARRMHTSGLINDETFAILENVPPEEVEENAVNNFSVNPDDVEDINRQMLLSSLTLLYDWREAAWRWEENSGTIMFTINGLEPRLTVTATDEREGQWQAMQRNYPQATDPMAVPDKGEDWNEVATTDLHSEMSAVLAHVDGVNNLRYIAGACGLTRFELAARVAQAAANSYVSFAGPEEAEDGYDIQKVNKTVDINQVIAAYMTAMNSYKTAREIYLEAEKQVQALAGQLQAAGFTPPPAVNPSDESQWS